jgi:hypothetical protein
MFVYTFLHGLAAPATPSTGAGVTRQPRVTSFGRGRAFEEARDIARNRCFMHRGRRCTPPAPLSLPPRRASHRNVLPLPEVEEEAEERKRERSDSSAR